MRGGCIYLLHKISIGLKMDYGLEFTLKSARFMFLRGQFIFLRRQRNVEKICTCYIRPF